MGEFTAWLGSHPEQSSNNLVVDRSGCRGDLSSGSPDAVGNAKANAVISKKLPKPSGERHLKVKLSSESGVSLQAVHDVCTALVRTATSRLQSCGIFGLPQFFKLRRIELAARGDGTRTIFGKVVALKAKPKRFKVGVVLSSSFVGQCSR